MQKSLIDSELSLHKLVVAILFAVLSLIILRKSDSFFSPYVVLYLAGTVCCFARYRYKTDLSQSEKRIDKMLPVLGGNLFAWIIVLANYRVIWEQDIKSDLSVLYEVGLFLILYIGTYFSASNIFYGIKDYSKKTLWKAQNHRLYQKIRPMYVFLVVFYVIFFIDFYFLSNCEYPGNLTEDSFHQLNQILTGDYSNHHPICYTLLFEMGYKIGMVLFHDRASAIAVFCVLQIIFMAASFSYAIMTTFQLKAPFWILLSELAYFAFMPFHIQYSYTVWKDVMFGGFVLLFCVSTYRKMNHIGKNALNCVIIFGSVIGYALFRSNGMMAIGLTFLIGILIFRKSQKQYLTIVLLALLFGVGVKYGLTKTYNIPQPDTIEYLSIPAQQIARVITNRDDLTEKEKILLSNVVEIRDIPDNYVEYISDPIKDLVREKGNQSYLKEHKGEYLFLYIRLGIRHPIEYIKAWIEETKGFWNAGYKDRIWGNMVVINEYGIRKVVASENVRTLFTDYCESFKMHPILQLFISIGLNIWIILFLIYRAYILRNKSILYILSTAITIVSTLVITTPVAFEFRYAYSVFCLIPIGIFLVEENHLIKF